MYHFNKLCPKLYSSFLSSFVKDYFNDSAKLEGIALSSTNLQWSKHAQAIKAGKKSPPTPPTYKDDRIIVRKTPLPSISTTYLI
jgi:hypothetical protein